jgi:hypothetical protein
LWHDLDLKGDVSKQHQRRTVLITSTDRKHSFCSAVVIYQVGRQLGDVERGMIDYPVSRLSSFADLDQLTWYSYRATVGYLLSMFQKGDGRCNSLLATDDSSSQQSWVLCAPISQHR